MRLAWCLVVCWLSVSPGWGATEASGWIVKVLPHFLDGEGRHTLSPSLYDRDAYQAYLRQHPEKRSGLRFDVQWKSGVTGKFVLRLQLRGRQGKETTSAVLEGSKRKRGLLSHWSALRLEGEAYRKFGELTAWRATLWDGDQMVSEKKSFLWEQ